jgi:hypothetical protein
MILTVWGDSLMIATQAIAAETWKGDSVEDSARDFTEAMVKETTQQAISTIEITSRGITSSQQK